MTITPNRPADNYSPLYFLASLGAGGLAASFYMYFLFWIPSPDQPVTVFEDIAAAFGQGDIMMQAMIVIVMAAIAILAYLNISYLIWNLKAYSAFKKTEAYKKLRNSNAETTLLAMPLAIAMSINVGFIIGMVFVPGLWSVVEYLFPLAMIAFGLTGWLALRLIGGFLGRVLSQGGVFDDTGNNSFAQLLPVFALSMIGVGFAAPAAMSTNTIAAGISLIGSTFFGVAAIIYLVVAASVAFNSMLRHGTAKESSPTILVLVPVMTVLGILFMRQNLGLDSTFGTEQASTDNLIFLTRLLAVQAVFLLLGLALMKHHGYFKDFVFGNKTSPGSYALVCPGVALSVMLHFFMNKGLVTAGIIDKFSPAFWIIVLIAMAFQLAMVALVFRLNKQHFGTTKPAGAVPAE